MSLEKQMKSGLVYCEYGHSSAQDRAYEQVIEFQRNHCKELMFDFNHTRPGDTRTKRRILEELLGGQFRLWLQHLYRAPFLCQL